MRLGISSYTYVWAAGVPGYPPPQPLTHAQLLERASELGVRVVQIADNMPLDGRSAGDLRALLRHAEELRLDLELGTSGLQPNYLRDQLRLAESLRSPLLRVVIDTEAPQPTPDEAVAALRAVMPDFERAGVYVAIENHDRFRAATLAAILDRVDSPNVGICLDTANSIGCVENLDTLLAVLGPRIINLHVKDYRILRAPHGKGFLVEGRPAGAGQLDIPALLAALGGSARPFSAIIELWPPPEAAIAATIAKEAAWARSSVNYLRRFLDA
jgi:sugar phosphate isomerase/epimerase